MRNSGQARSSNLFWVEEMGMHYAPRGGDPKSPGLVGYRILGHRKLKKMRRIVEGQNCYYCLKFE